MSRSQPNITPQAIAHHLAGQAVVAIRLGRDIHDVTIITDYYSAGRVRLTRPPTQVERFFKAADTANPHDDPRVVQWIEHDIIIELAGSIAQRDYSSRPVRHYRRGYSGLFRPDAHQTNFYFWNLHGNGKVAAAYQAYLEARAEVLVSQESLKIHKVARALLQHKTLSGDAVRTAMNPEPKTTVALLRQVEEIDSE